MTDFDSMFGGPEEPPKPRGMTIRASEPRVLAPLEMQREIKTAITTGSKISERDFLLPVTIAFMAKILRLDPRTITARLQRSPVKPIGYGAANNKRPVYDFAKTVPYVVKNEMDTQTLIETVNPWDLPPMVNKTVAEAKRTWLKYAVEAGQAWATDDVLEVFGVVWMTIKERTRQWQEDLREECRGKTGEEVLDMLAEKVDEYQEGLHADLVEIPHKRQTRSKAAEHESGAIGNVVHDYDEDESE